MAKAVDIVVRAERLDIVEVIVVVSALSLAVRNPLAGIVAALVIHLCERWFGGKDGS